MERSEIWSEMAKIMGEIAGESVEWDEEWLPDIQQEDEGPPGAWRVTFTSHLPDDTKIGGYIVVSPALLERAPHPSQYPSLFEVIAREFGHAARRARVQ